MFQCKVYLTTQVTFSPNLPSLMTGYVMSGNLSGTRLLKPTCMIT